MPTSTTRWRVGRSLDPDALLELRGFGDERDWMAWRIDYLNGGLLRDDLQALCKTDAQRVRIAHDACRQAWQDEGAYGRVCWI